MNRQPRAMRGSSSLLVVRMQQGGPEVVARALPVDFLRTVLQPICQSHVAVSQVDGICTASLRRDRVLLGQHEPHNLTQLNILQEECDVGRIRGVFGGLVDLVIDKVVFRRHLHVRIVRIDMNRTPEGYGDASISGEQSPPNPFPKSFVRSSELGGLHTAMC
jgi:hypothetical protein